MKNVINRAFMAKKKILFVLAAVMFCAASTSAQCVYNRTTGVIKIYKHDGSLKGDFTINSSGDKVKFSEGNLQYNSGTQKWQFAANQWDYVGNAAGNTSVTESGIANNSGIVDLFGWVGASSIWDTELKKHGLTSSTATNNTDGYGNVVTENLKDDWGSLMGTGWRTLTNSEWTYIINYRSGNRYAKANIHGVNGMILLPDGWTQAESAMSGTLGGINKSNGSFSTVSDADWTILAGEGCVFLPAAGYRIGTSVSEAGSYGIYWSSTPQEFYVIHANCFQFRLSDINPSSFYDRYHGLSVRLVKDVVVTP